MNARKQITRSPVDTLGGCLDDLLIQPPNASMGVRPALASNPMHATSEWNWAPLHKRSRGLAP